MNSFLLYRWLMVMLSFNIIESIKTKITFQNHIRTKLLSNKFDCMHNSTININSIPNKKRNIPTHAYVQWNACEITNDMKISNDWHSSVIPVWNSFVIYRWFEAWNKLERVEPCKCRQICSLLVLKGKKFSKSKYYQKKIHYTKMISR